MCDTHTHQKTSKKKKINDNDFCVKKTHALAVIKWSGKKKYRKTVKDLD